MIVGIPPLWFAAARHSSRQFEVLSRAIVRGGSRRHEGVFVPSLVWGLPSWCGDSPRGSLDIVPSTSRRRRQVVLWPFSDLGSSWGYTGAGVRGIDLRGHGCRTTSNHPVLPLWTISRVTTATHSSCCTTRHYCASIGRGEGDSATVACGNATGMAMNGLI